EAGEIFAPVPPFAPLPGGTIMAPAQPDDEDDVRALAPPSEQDADLQAALSARLAQAVCDAWFAGRAEVAQPSNPLAEQGIGASGGTAAVAALLAGLGAGWAPRRAEERSRRRPQLPA